jgi:hypothetical protein
MTVYNKKVRAFVPYKHSCPFYLSTQSFVWLLGLHAKNSVQPADILLQFLQ